MNKLIILAIFSLLSVSLATKCRDGSFCPGAQTCCLGARAKVVCCQYQDANCCGDGIHCCPNGYQCDLARNLCRRGDHELAFVSTTESTPASFSGFLAPEQSLEMKEERVSIYEIFRCVNKLRPYASDIFEALRNFNKDDSAAIEQAKTALTQLTENGTEELFDCARKLEQLIKESI